VFLLISKRDRDRRVHVRRHQNAQICSSMIMNLIGGHFCEDTYVRDDHGHASKSKSSKIKILLNFLVLNCFI